jgi:hypothetical protein
MTIGHQVEVVHLATTVILYCQYKKKIILMLVLRGLERKIRFFVEYVFI